MSVEKGTLARLRSWLFPPRASQFITIPEIQKANSPTSPDRISHLQAPYMGSTAGPFVMPYPSDTNGIHIMVRHNLVANAIVTNIRNEVWRKDPILKPKFGAICDSCGKEYEDNLEQLQLRAEGGRRTRMKPDGSAEEDGTRGRKQCPKCGYAWNPQVSDPKKCPECNAILRKQEPVEDESPGDVSVACEECGGALREPDESQKLIWRDFALSRNTHGLIFREVAEVATDAITSFDDGYLIKRFNYLIGPDGQIKTRDLIEILNGSPIRMRMIADERYRKGRYMQHADGRGYWTCPEHRINNVRPSPGRCEVKGCNKVLYPCEYVALGDEAQEDIGYIEGEVFHWSEYMPGEGYGHSPILVAWTALCLIENVVRLANAVYQNRRPPKGILAVNTRNVLGLQSQLDIWAKRQETDPNALCTLAIEIGSKGHEGRTLEWIPLTQDLNELQAMPLLKEARERVEAIFGVSNIMMADSVTGDVPVYLRRDGRWIDIVPIRSLHKKDSIIYSKGFENVEILSADGWTKIHHSYRHPVRKRMFDIFTGSGRTKVTEDHSLMRGGVETTAADLKVGDRIDWGAPTFNSVGTMSENEAWLLGVFCAEGSTRDHTTAIAQNPGPVFERIKDTMERVLCTKVNIRENHGCWQAYSCRNGVFDYFRRECYDSTTQRRTINGEHRNEEILTKKVPVRILNGTPEVKRAFLEGYYAGDGNLDRGVWRSDSISMTLSAGLAYLNNALGTSVNVSWHKGKNNVTRLVQRKENRRSYWNTRRVPENEIKRMQEYEIDDFVYDVETENHTFVAGVGYMVHHNTSQSGGLNNEGLQITVALRTIDRRQATWEMKIFPHILEILGITDYRLEFPPPKEEDRMAVLERKRLNLEEINTVMEMGGEVKIVDDEDLEWKLVGSLKRPRSMGMSPAPSDPENPNAGGEHNEDYRGEKPRGEVTGKIPTLKAAGGETASHAAPAPFLSGSSLIANGRVIKR